MEKKLKLLLTVSIFFNIFFIFHNHFNKSTIWNPTWSSRAAVEAEAAASVQCSGHGRAYVDGLGALDGRTPPCECNQCYTGTDCSVFLPHCDVDADSGDPLFLEPFWMQRAESSAVVVSGWHRMSYMYLNVTNVSEELEKIIRKLHYLVGNTVTDNRFVIFGTGSTQLLAAAVHALSHTNTNSSSLSSPARLVTSVPYYSMYQEQAEFFNSMDLKFEGDASVWKSKHNDNTTRVIEIVTSPNNPDGELKKSVLEGSNVEKVHDFAYYWPYFTPITEKADEDLSLFSISKTTGHAGSRFGWALVKDESIYKRMKSYIHLTSMGVSRDTQLRVLQLLKVVVSDGGEEIFKFGYETLKKRWETLKMIFSMSTRFSIQTMKPEYCNYFKRVRDFTPSYAWVKCERPEDMNCYEIFRRGKITGRKGKLFGAEERFVRLSLIRAQDDFDLLVDRLMNLVISEEDVTTLSEHLMI